MTEENTTSPSAPATGAPGPAMGQNAPVGATPAAAPSLTLEEALKKLADLEHTHGNTKEELDRHRKFRASYDKQQAEAEAAKKAEADAQLSEVERYKKLHTETEQQASKYKQELISAKVAMAASAKGIIDPELAALALSMKNQAWTLEYDDDEMPTNVEKALDALIKNKPNIVSKPADPPATATPTPAQTARAPRFATPALPAMNPGRTQIAQPGSLPFGKPVRLADIRRNK